MNIENTKNIFNTEDDTLTIISKIRDITDKGTFVLINKEELYKIIMLFSVASFIFAFLLFRGL